MGRHRTTPVRYVQLTTDNLTQAWTVAVWPSAADVNYEPGVCLVLPDWFAPGPYMHFDFDQLLVVIDDPLEVPAEAFTCPVRRCPYVRPRPRAEGWTAVRRNGRWELP
jgi:hypothetical protein